MPKSKCLWSAPAGSLERWWWRFRRGFQWGAKKGFHWQQWGFYLRNMRHSIEHLGKFRNKDGHVLNKLHGSQLFKRDFTCNNLQIWGFNLTKWEWNSACLTQQSCGFQDWRNTSMYATATVNGGKKTNKDGKIMGTAAVQLSSSLWQSKLAMKVYLLFLVIISNH